MLKIKLTARSSGNTKNSGFETVDDAALADIAIVNTCGFIDSAKRESIDEVLELCTLKTRVKLRKSLLPAALQSVIKRKSTRIFRRWTLLSESVQTARLPKSLTK